MLLLNDVAWPADETPRGHVSSKEKKTGHHTFESILRITTQPPSLEVPCLLSMSVADWLSTPSSTTRRFVHDRSDVLQIIVSNVRCIKQIETYFALVPGCSRDSENIILNAARCQMVEHGVIGHCQNAVIILHGGGCI